MKHDILHIGGTKAFVFLMIGVARYQRRIVLLALCNEVTFCIEESVELGVNVKAIRLSEIVGVQFAEIILCYKLDIAFYFLSFSNNIINLNIVTQNLFVRLKRVFMRRDQILEQ